MRTISLNNAQGGINRLRVKGSPQDRNLYDLLNGFVNEAGAIQSRPGTLLIEDAIADTKGLCAFNGKLVVFSNLTTVTPSNPLVRVEVLVDPLAPFSAILRIHFAAPYLGYLYVVAEFASGNTYHYWLQDGVTWGAKTLYNVGDVVIPTVPNGFAYRAHRLGDPAPVWTANAPRAVNDVVEPTEPNGWKFTVTAVTGDTPRSGSEEPEWNTGTGATTVEDADLGAIANPPATGGTAPGDNNDSGSLPTPPGVGDRYERFDSIGYQVVP